MGRAGHRVFRHAHGWRKEPGDEVDVREIGNSRDDDAPGPDGGEGVHVGFETTDIICQGQFHQDIEPFWPVYNGSTPSAWPRPGTGMDVAAGSAGKSMLIQSSFCRMASVPERVSKAIGFSRETRPVSQRTDAAASVAWPHNSTSFSGVNHRRFQFAPSGKRNAVSECFSSSCHLLHPRRIGRTIRDTDTRRVAAERGAGEGINKVQFCVHGGEIACRCV